MLHGPTLVTMQYPSGWFLEQWNPNVCSVEELEPALVPALFLELTMWVVTFNNMPPYVALANEWDAGDARCAVDILSQAGDVCSIWHVPNTSFGELEGGDYDLPAKGAFWEYCSTFRPHS